MRRWSEVLWSQIYIWRIYVNDRRFTCELCGQAYVNWHEEKGNPPNSDWRVRITKDKEGTSSLQDTESGKLITATTRQPQTRNANKSKNSRNKTNEKGINLFVPEVLNKETVYETCTDTVTNAQIPKSATELAHNVNESDGDESESTLETTHIRYSAPEKSPHPNLFIPEVVLHDDTKEPAVKNEVTEPNSDIASADSSWEQNVKTDSKNQSASNSASNSVEMVEPDYFHLLLLETKEEMAEQLHNLRTLLICSNATPIKVQFGHDYECSFCTVHSPDSQVIKNHILETHTDSYGTFMNELTNLSMFMAKMDITNLKCRICSGNFLKVQQLMEHLSDHGYFMKSVEKDYILPFKFIDNTIVCGHCANSFTCFRSALNHIRSHYCNFSCSQCNTSFITVHQYRTHHFNMHKDKVFKKDEEAACDICQKVFKTKSYVRIHKKQVHDNATTAVCKFCPERFRSSYQKLKHMIDVHNYKPIEEKCTMCDQTFICKLHLRQHFKRYHCNEEKHVCRYCGKSFVDKKSLTEHAILHTGEKPLQCEVCHKFYGRKRTLREHMRIHKNDRRFKCDVCGQAFVQKYGWKLHMANKHAIIIA